MFPKGLGWSAKGILQISPFTTQLLRGKEEEGGGGVRGWWLSGRGVRRRGTCRISDAWNPQKMADCIVPV